MKKILATLTAAMISIMALAQNDHLHIINRVAFTEELWSFQELVLDNWDGAQKYLDQSKLKFFNLDDRASFYDYMRGSYDDPPKDLIRVKNAEAITPSYILQAEDYINAKYKTEYDPEDIKILMDNISDFWTVRCADWDTKLYLYELYNKVKKYFKNSQDSLNHP